MLREFSLDAFSRGVQRFLQDDTFDELNRINNIRGQNGRRGKRNLTRPSDRRDAVWTAMEQWPAGEWMSFDEAWRLVYAAGQTPTVSEDCWLLPALGNVANHTIWGSPEGKTEPFQGSLPPSGLVGSNSVDVCGADIPVMIGQEAPRRCQVCASERARPGAGLRKAVSPRLP